MKIIHEELKNGEWILIEYFKVNIQNIVQRQQVIEKNCVIAEYWYLNNDMHRLDGPAYKNIWIGGGTKWYVYGIHLVLFEEFVDNQKKIKLENMFDYVSRYPQHAKAVELICLHNNWLTNDQCDLMKTITLFKK